MKVTIPKKAKTAKKYYLERLLKSVKKSNIHKEISFGQPLGKEYATFMGAMARFLY